jgi:transcriptional regulator GlxA family with amidase domain
VQVPDAYRVQVVGPTDDGTITMQNGLGLNVAPLPEPPPPALRELQAWIAGHLHEDLTVPVLAERALMSERSFARSFHREVGQTPAAYVEALRIERARSLLEDGAPSLEAVAQATGFASAVVLRRAFHRHLGVSPADYRDRFRLAA